MAVDIEELKPILPKLIEAYLDWHSMGANLHVILEDGNIDDHFIDGGIRDCIADGDLLGQLIATILQAYSEDERDAMFECNWTTS